jgi:hypothetical protein
MITIPAFRHFRTAGGGYKGKNRLLAQKTSQRGEDHKWKYVIDLFHEQFSTAVMAGIIQKTVCKASLHPAHGQPARKGSSKAVASPARSP